MVDCQITAHASPRWKAARNEQDRIIKNEKLARERGQKVAAIVEQHLRNNLGEYALDFKFNQSLSHQDTMVPSTVSIGDISYGQTRSIVEAHGDRANDEARFRRVDISVRIAHKTDEFLPYEVIRKSNKSTKTKHWYVSVGGGIGLHVGAGVTLLFVDLRNEWNQKATGAAYAAGVGVGLSGIGEAVAAMTKEQLIRAAASASFSDETRFSTNKEVGFEDFHGRRIRYTSAGIQFVIGGELSYITFSGMGDGAESISVGGVSLAADAGLSLSTGVGLLGLFDVPSDWIVVERKTTKFQRHIAQWDTDLATSVYFPSGSSDANALIPHIGNFVAKVAEDFRGF